MVNMFMIMYEEYGIKEDNEYNITFKLDNKTRRLYVCGRILNFTPEKIIIKSIKGLYIIPTKNIIQMIPIK